VTTRYVIVHPQWGVLLTDPPTVFAGLDQRGVTFVWTKKAKSIKIKTAPTFASWAEFDRISYRAPTAIPDTERRKMELKEVWPDKPNFQASPESCENAGLPRWDTVGE
jgi:hypothetical protein